MEFLQVIPIYESERGRKVELGVDAFMEEWEEVGVPFWSASRPPAVPGSL